MAVTHQLIQPRQAPHQRFDREIYLRHIKTVCDIMNDELKRCRVPIRFHSDHLTKNDLFRFLIKDTTIGMNIQRFIEAQSRGETIPGMMHETQVLTLANIIVQFLKDPIKMILVLGAMQAGKTGTANGCHLIGPIFFLLSGIKYYPVKLLPVRKGSGNQTRDEFQMWCSLYQELRIECLDTKEVISFRKYQAKAEILKDFLDDDGMLSYSDFRRWVMQDKLEPRIRQIVKLRRTDGSLDAIINQKSGRFVPQVNGLFQAAKDEGFSILLINDEPHWGSSIGSIQDRMLTSFRQMREISSHHMMICFDATPFAITNADQFLVVRHRLSANYCGPNCFGGEPLDPTVETKDVLVHSLREYAVMCDDPDFAIISRKAYTGSTAMFDRWLHKWNDRFNGNWRYDFNEKTTTPLKLTQPQYRKRVEASLRRVLHDVLTGEKKEARTRGICLRLMASNEESRLFMDKLNLDKQIKVITYMAQTAQLSVSDVIETEAPTGPYIVVVTGAARMADWFPQHCSHFFDFTDFISNQTSLMQGSYGRACGFGEPRHVIMLERGVEAIRAYLDSNGLDGLHPGKDSSVPTGARGAPLRNIRLRRDTCDSDPIARALIQRMQKEIIDTLPWGNGNCRTVQMTLQHQGKAYVPIWGIFDDAAMCHIESNYKTLLPECGQQPKILRKDEVFYAKGGVAIGVDLSDNPKLRKKGYGKIGLRDWEAYIKSDHRTDGMASKGKFKMKSSDRSMRPETRTLISGLTNGGRYQPQVWLDQDVKRQRWILREIVFRLRESVRAAPVIDDDDGLIYASANNLFSKYHSEAQQNVVHRRIIDRAAKVKRRRRAN